MSRDGHIKKVIKLFPLYLYKRGIEGPAGPVNAVPLSEAMCNAGLLFDRGHTHLIAVPVHALMNEYLVNIIHKVDLYTTTHKSC